MKRADEVWGYNVHTCKRINKHQQALISHTFGSLLDAFLVASRNLYEIYAPVWYPADVIRY